MHPKSFVSNFLGSLQSRWVSQRFEKLFLQTHEHTGNFSLQIDWEAEKREKTDVSVATSYPLC